MFKTTKERRQREFEVRRQHAGMIKHVSEAAMEYGRRPPYRYTNLCPEKKEEVATNG